MQFLPQYSMMSSMATTFILGIVFLFLWRQSAKSYMGFWGLCWLTSSILAFLDFQDFQVGEMNVVQTVCRQAVVLFCTLLFFYGTTRFFRIRFYGFPLLGSCILLLLFAMVKLFPWIYIVIVIPSIVFSSGLLVLSGCMFLCYSWTDNLPEKGIAGFFIILWAIFINHFGFAISNQAIATATYFIGILLVNILIVLLLVIYFKKIRFLDNKQAARFRLLVENSSDSMFLYDYAAEAFEYVSPMISGLVRVPAEELYKMPERFFDHIETPERHQEILSIFRRPISHANSGSFCLVKDGAVEKWVEIHYLPISDATGKVTAIEGILRDVTERWRMEEEIKEMDRARKELIENISHDVRTPITLISGYTEGLLRNVIPEESQPVYLKLINSKVMMLNMLLEDLQQASSFPSQKIEYRFYEQAAAAFFEELTDACNLEVTQAQMFFHKEIRISADVVVILDPHRIEQVVTNMLNNSIRHTPKGGIISIYCYICPGGRASADGGEEQENTTIPRGELVFTISDTGEGIPVKDIKRIFERKYQSHGGSFDWSPAPDNKGLGLGLYISRQIIKQHSGRIWAENNSAGGANVSFSIPYYQ